LVLPFWYRPTRVVLDKGPLNGCVCVCSSRHRYFSTGIQILHSTSIAHSHLIATRRENRTCVPNARVDVFWNRVHCPITTRHSTQAEVTSTLSIYLSIYLSVCLSVYLSIYLSIYLADGQQNLSNFVLISKRVGVFIGAKQHAVAGASRYTPDPHLQPTAQHA